ncbi:hypothetical protein ADIMK_2539 [Marinobacterium lacunae]|uniref:Hydrogenase maturation protease n=1 Tax=Marinobacterium lacunae TaxID=1232683 RepID=A0A081FWW0_9GAMM|nr:hydrogenase maturation protease [Marinobacterium lacunae]KEA63015.1 hypothetical protein ADIMK_2539 [Marinobacterium lacunae]MBR9883077.1 hydrogenase maturation protease [Oceanospirillales bacterium]
MKHDRLQIIGLGSPAGDDRLGWEVIERLEAILPETAECDLTAYDRPGAGLIKHLAEYKHCWLVDALWSADDEPGVYTRPDLETLKHARTGVAGSHGFGVADTLMLASRLGALPDSLELHCLTINSADRLGEHLSPAIDAGVDGLVKRLYQRLIQSVDHSV